MVITVMKITFKKRSLIDIANILIRLKNDLKEKLSADITNYESFETFFIEVQKNMHH